MKQVIKSKFSNIFYIFIATFLIFFIILSGLEINFSKHIIPLLFCPVSLFSQTSQLEFITLESKANGIVVQLKMDTIPDINNITAWQANSGWFYITLYQVTGDSSALMPRKIPSDITDFQIIENDESLQLGIRLIKTIENHEFSSLEDENSIVASLHYSTEYLAQLDTVKKMNLR